MYRHDARIHDADAASDPVIAAIVAASDLVGRDCCCRRHRLSASDPVVAATAAVIAASDPVRCDRCCRRHRLAAFDPVRRGGHRSRHHHCRRCRHNLHTAIRCLTSSSLLISCFSIYDYEYASHHIHAVFVLDDLRHTCL